MGNLFSFEKPGKVKIAHERGHYHGCAFKYFQNGEQINQFFVDNPMMLIIEVYPDATTGGFTVLYDRQMDEEEAEEFKHYSEHMESLMREWREKRAAARAQSELDKEAAEIENKRLIDVGIKCEQNHKKAKGK